MFFALPGAWDAGLCVRYLWEEAVIVASDKGVLIIRIGYMSRMFSKMITFILQPVDINLLRHSLLFLSYKYILWKYTSLSCHHLRQHLAVTPQALIRNTSQARVAHQGGILPQSTPLVPQSRRLPGLPPLLHLSLGDLKINNPLFRINDDGVAVLNQGNWATLNRLRNNVANDETVRSTGETTISQESDVVAKTGAHD